MSSATPTPSPDHYVRRPGSCACDLHEVPAGIDGVNWYWQRHTRKGCTLELPNARCWCGRLRSEHLDGHDPKAEEKSADSSGDARRTFEGLILAVDLDHPKGTSFVVRVPATEADAIAVAGLMIRPSAGRVLVTIPETLFTGKAQ